MQLFKVFFLIRVILIYFIFSGNRRAVGSKNTQLDHDCLILVDEPVPDVARDPGILFKLVVEIRDDLERDLF
jgi:hypothetical protein